MFENTEAMFKIKTLSAGSTGALATPTSFITKTVQDQVESSPLANALESLLPVDSAITDALGGVAERMGSALPSTVSDVNSLLGNVASSVSSAMSGATSALSSALGGAVSDFSGTLSGAMSGAGGLAEGISGAISSATSSSGLLGSLPGISDLSNLPTADMLSSISGLTGNLTSGLTGLPDLSSLADASAMASGLSDIASGLNLPTNPLALTGDLGSLGELSGGIGELSGITPYMSGIDSPLSGLTDILSSAASSLGSVTDLVSSITSDIPLVSSLSDLLSPNSLLSGIESLTSSPFLNSTVASAANSLLSNDLVESVVEGVADWIDVSDLDSLSTLSTGILDMSGVETADHTSTSRSERNTDTSSISDIINSVIPELPSVLRSIRGLDVASVLSEVYSFGSSTSSSTGTGYKNTGFKTYPRYSGSSTAGSSGIPSNTLKDITKSVNDLCAGADSGYGGSYRSSKDSFDLMTYLLSAMGLDGLLSGLGNCSELMDDRTENILKDFTIPVAIDAGNPYLYKAAGVLLGTDSISDPVGDLRDLNSNMYVNPDIDNVDSKYDTYSGLLDMFGIGASDLTGGSEYSGIEESYSTEYIASMSKSNTDVVSSLVGESTVKTALSVLSFL